MKTYSGIGVSLTTSSGPWQRVGLVESVQVGAMTVGDRIIDALAQVASLVTGNVPANQLSGPVGIMRISYEATTNAMVSKIGMANFFSLFALLSVFIG